jgi:DNA-binding MarR family transcriptional regulator
MDAIIRFKCALEFAHEQCGVETKGLLTFLTLASFRRLSKVELGAHCKLPPATAHNIVVKLIEKGLIKQYSSPQGGNRTDLEITVKGSEIAKMIATKLTA